MTKHTLKTLQCEHHKIFSHFFNITYEKVKAPNTTECFEDTMHLFFNFHEINKKRRLKCKLFLY